MKHLKRILAIGLSILTITVSAAPAHATSSPLPFSGVKVSTDGNITTLEYYEQKDGTLFHVNENMKGNTIESYFYVVDNGKERLNSTVHSEIISNTIDITEIPIVGEPVHYQIEIDKASESYSAPLSIGKFDKNMAVTRSNSKKFLRTDTYGISLVGKKVSVAIAAGALALACPHIGVPVAISIISAAIGIGAQTIPNYVYVVSDVYATISNGKRYTRYYDKFYLDSAHTQYIGSWTCSVRAGH